MKLGLGQTSWNGTSWRRGTLALALVVLLPRPAAGAPQGRVATIRSVIDGTRPSWKMADGSGISGSMPLNEVKPTSPRRPLSTDV